MSTGTHQDTRKAQANGSATVVGKAFPAPSRLSTKTDLASQEVLAVSEALNPLVADLFALYLKTKNFHWHLSGPHFRDYHLLFDEQGDQIFAATDQLAERVRRIGATTIRSIAHISQLQTIADDNQDFVPAREMAQRLMDDNGALARNMRAAHEICDRSRDYATASILEILIDEAERRTWFLFEIVQAGDNAR
ncbi:MAG TPA: DNA starvation/stationary phase protection protein [Usitatibacter sp.]|jgi:starvation-inducible DNA-binding protein